MGRANDPSQSETITVSDVSTYTNIKTVVQSYNFYNNIPDKSNSESKFQHVHLSLLPEILVDKLLNLQS